MFLLARPPHGPIILLVSWRNSRRARRWGEGREILYFSSSLRSLAFFFSLTPTQRVAISPGGGTPLCKLYRYEPPHRVGFLCRFCLKTGIHFTHFGQESGMVFGGITGEYERIYRFNTK